MRPSIMTSGWLKTWSIEDTMNMMNDVNKRRGNACNKRKQGRLRMAQKRSAWRGVVQRAWPTQKKEKELERAINTWKLGQPLPNSVETNGNTDGGGEGEDEAEEPNTADDATQQEAPDPLDGSAEAKIWGDGRDIGPKGTGEATSAAGGERLAGRRLADASSHSGFLGPTVLVGTLTLRRRSSE